MAIKVNLTSMYTGVGKSSLIVMMARQLQEEGNTVLIIDNSHKVSRLHGMFGLPKVDRTLDEVIPLTKMAGFTFEVLSTYINTIDDKIDLIGCSRKNIMDPISMDNMMELIDFYGDYDYILVESPVRFMLKTIPNIIVIDGRVIDYKNAISSGQTAIINKFDSMSGLSLKKYAKEALTFPYEPTMVSYELTGKFKFSEETYTSLEDLLSLIDTLNEGKVKDKPNQNSTNGENQNDKVSKLSQRMRLGAGE